MVHTPTLYKQRKIISKKMMAGDIAVLISALLVQHLAIRRVLSEWLVSDVTYLGRICHSVGLTTLNDSWQILSMTLQMLLGSSVCPA
jgi:hypothetical protein